MEYYINNRNYKIKVQGEKLLLPKINRDLGIDKRDDIFVITDIKTGVKISENKNKKIAIKQAIELQEQINNFSKEKENKLIEILNKLVDYTTYNKYLRDFSNIFNYDILSFCNEWILNISGIIKIDMEKFEKFLQYEPSYINISLKEFINKKYGKDVLEAVEYFI